MASLAADRDAWDERYRSKDSVWGAAANRFVVEVFAGRPAGRALDLACGEGRNALWLAGLGWAVTAVDFADTALERGRQASQVAGLDIEWITEDLLSYEPAAGSFDAVLIAYLHLPAEQMATVLERGAAALAPGGTLMLVGYDVRNLTEGVGGPQDAALLHTPERVVAHLDGLRIERAESVARPVEAAPRPAVDTLVVGVRHEDRPPPRKRHGRST